MSKKTKSRKIIVRVNGQANQGGRKEMEDFKRVVFDRDPEQAFFAVFDGHGGRDAAIFARDNLWDNIKKQKGFYSGDTARVIKAIKDGFLITHRHMWKQLDSWPRTRHGLPSTSGTTATVVILKGRTLYIAHVGDSGAALGRLNKERKLQAVPLTADHKPDVPSEKSRIESLGGKVLSRNGVPRVAWERPVHHGHKGPVRRSTERESVPFLAISRALGDLWSFNYYRNEFIVSPVPDIRVYKITPGMEKFLVIASDGLWGVMRVEEVVKFVHNFDKDDICNLGDVSHRLIQRALARWRERDLRADNTSVIVVHFDEITQDEPPMKIPRLDKTLNEEETESETKESTDSSQASDKTPNQDSLFNQKPALVRKLAFRCSNPIISLKNEHAVVTEAGRQGIELENISV
ncbi:protein phosphatase 1D-like [Acropora muricata]|uniref:protein phosphatase 1D-like n=1 Tax=Acropora millepora TaxID=45264 RepID=UPI0010FC874D|nr:protein phosphatase 1D-like [Acropora millepora]